MWFCTSFGWSDVVMLAAGEYRTAGEHGCPLLFQHDAQMDYYGTRLATCSSDRTVKIFDVRNGGQILVADLRGYDDVTITLTSTLITLSVSY